MHVGAAVPFERIESRCRRRTGHSEWAATPITFELELEPDHAGRTSLRLHQLGPVPSLPCFEVFDVSSRHFLASNVGDGEHGRGQPFDDRFHHTS